MEQTPRLGSPGGQAKPTINEPTEQVVESWNPTELLKWIQQKLTPPLDHGGAEKFLNAEIDGAVFLGSAGDKDFYTRPSIGLSFGASFRLAELARKIKGKFCSPYTNIEVCRVSRTNCSKNLPPSTLSPWKSKAINLRIGNVFGCHSFQGQAPSTKQNHLQYVVGFPSTPSFAFK